MFDFVKRLLGFTSEAEVHARRFADAFRVMADDAEAVRDRLRLGYGMPAAPEPAGVALPADADGNVTLTPVKRGRNK
jgi:hypothetical protein